MGGPYCVAWCCSSWWRYRRTTEPCRAWCLGQLANVALHWRHNEHDDVSNHQLHHCLLNRLFGSRSKKTSKLRVTGLCAGNSPETGEFPAQMARNAENVSISWWYHGNQWRCVVAKMISNNTSLLRPGIQPRCWYANQQKYSQVPL